MGKVLCVDMQLYQHNTSGNWKRKKFGNFILEICTKGEGEMVKMSEEVGRLEA